MTGSSSKLLQIQGKRYQERKPTKRFKTGNKKYQTLFVTPLQGPNYWRRPMGMCCIELIERITASTSFSVQSSKMGVEVATDPVLIPCLSKSQLPLASKLSEVFNNELLVVNCSQGVEALFAVLLKGRGFPVLSPSYMLRPEPKICLGPEKINFMTKYLCLMTKWVCLKIGYIPNYSHLIGIMIINHWV